MADKGIDLGDAGSASAAGAGANYLLAIAIDEYQHCPRLYNCVNDARRLIGVLSTQYQFEKENTFTLFNEHATGRALRKDRLDALASEGGISDCGNAQNCVKVCPKHIPLTESIGAMGRATTIHAIASFFTGKK